MKKIINFSITIIILLLFNNITAYATEEINNTGNINIKAVVEENISILDLSAMIEFINIENNEIYDYYLNNNNSYSMLCSIPLGIYKINKINILSKDGIEINDYNYNYTKDQIEINNIDNIPEIKIEIGDITKSTNTNIINNDYLNEIDTETMDITEGYVQFTVEVSNEISDNNMTICVVINNKKTNENKEIYILKENNYISSVSLKYNNYEISKVYAISNTNDLKIYPYTYNKKSFLISDVKEDIIIKIGDNNINSESIEDKTNNLDDTEKTDTIIKDQNNVQNIEKQDNKKIEMIDTNYTKENENKTISGKIKNNSKNFIKKNIFNIIILSMSIIVFFIISIKNNTFIKRKNK